MSCLPTIYEGVSQRGNCDAERYAVVAIFVRLFESYKRAGTDNQTNNCTIGKSINWCNICFVSGFQNPFNLYVNTKLMIADGLTKP